MKLTNGELDNLQGPLTDLLKEKLPIATSFKLAKLAASLQEPVRVMQTCKEKIYATHGTPDPKNPALVRIDPQGEDFPKFAKDLGELMAQEVDIDFEPVALPGTVQITPSVLMALDRFVTVETN